MKATIVLVSYHHNNTEKVAKEMAAVLGADVKKVGSFDPKELAGYDLLGFGSGIYMGKHHRSLLKMVASMPALNKKAFILSTSGAVPPMPGSHNVLCHSLQGKGLNVIDEFNCPGYDTVLPIRLLHGGKGANEGRPNEDDLKKAKEFAMKLLEKI